MIVIGGTVGIGKSTVAKAIGEFYNSKVFYESVDDNPILEKFYNDPKKWAFTLQVYFAQSRMNLIKEATLLNDPHVVLDRSIYEDYLFTLMNYEHGNMEKEHFDTYVQLFDYMVDEWTGAKKVPDLFIYLRGSFETVLKRMAMRGRDFEMGEEKLEYFRDLHSRYDDWVNTHYDASEVLVIDMDKYDVNIPEHRDFIMEIINFKLTTILKSNTHTFYKFVVKTGDGTYHSPGDKNTTFKLDETTKSYQNRRDPDAQYGIYGYTEKDWTRKISLHGKDNLVLIKCKANHIDLIKEEDGVCVYRKCVPTKEISDWKLFLDVALPDRLRGTVGTSFRPYSG